MKLSCLFALLVVASPALSAQVPAPPPATGTVTGHVFLADSRLPARMASVSLISTKPTQPTSADSTSRNTAWSAKVQSMLDGSFTIPHVPPGDYYLLAEKIGYISPGHLPMGPYYMTKEEEEALAKQVAPITVAANQTTAVDTFLIRGASISGVVRFDDGSPDAEGWVALLHKDKSGKWVPYLPATTAFNPSGEGGNLADDQGRFRFVGLPAGEYLLKSILQIDRGMMRDDKGDSLINADYAIDCYYGDVIRQKDAKTIKVAEGEQSDGDNIEIPLAKLHPVTGNVVSIETGAPVNSATLELHYADDDSLAAKTEMNPAWNGFSFPYVPEGTYTIKVMHAADVSIARNPLDDEKPIRSYTDASQPLIVKGETNGVTIQVKPQPAAANAPATP